MNLKHFLVKTVIVAVSVFVLDRGTGLLLGHYYHRLRHGEQGRMNWAIDSCRAGIIILGSSRAAHHYVPEIIGAGLGSSCYNAGKDKQRLPYCLALLKAMYARYNPRCIILDLNPTAFTSDEKGLNELSALLPYYKTNPEMQPVIDRRNRFERLKAQSMLYCYNSLPLKILFNSLSGARETGEENGYLPLHTQKEAIPAVPAMLPDDFPLDTATVNCFGEIADLAEKHKSRLIVVVSPIYNRLLPDMVTLRMARSITKARGIAFIDFSQQDYFLRYGPACFLDQGHLNDSSARYFSALLTRVIRQVNPIRPP